jgi:SAM-dependent methyltransferase
MFHDVVFAGLFRRFHQDVDDALLDEAARIAGCASGIGRLSLLSDDLLGEILEHLHASDASRILDIGCGRGFLERWLHRHGKHVRAVGVDRAPEAIAAAKALAPDAQFVEADYRSHRFPEPFDTVVALEIATSGAIDGSLVAAVRSALREGGGFAITAASLDGKHEERLEAARAQLAQHFAAFELLDSTQPAAEFAVRLYGAWLQIESWSPTIRPRMEAQAREVLDSIERGDFHYAIALGQA